MVWTDPFRTACVLVCARLWSDLEQRLMALTSSHVVGVGEAMGTPLDLWRETVLLELELLKDRCAALRARQCLTASEVECVADLVARIGEALAFELTALMPQVELCIARAQNVLFDEVKALTFSPAYLADPSQASGSRTARTSASQPDRHRAHGSNAS